MLKYGCADGDFIPLCWAGNSVFVFEFLLIFRLFLTLYNLRSKSEIFIEKIRTLSYTLKVSVFFWLRLCRTVPLWRKN